MYEITVEAEFFAEHALRLAGRTEPVHGHTFRVEVTVAGTGLNADGVLVDFHELERALHAVLTPLQGASLNETPPFVDTSPSAEALARHIADSLAASCPLPPGARISRVSITEAPGCRGVYLPDEP